MSHRYALTFCLFLLAGSLAAPALAQESSGAPAAEPGKAEAGKPAAKPEAKPAKRAPAKAAAELKPDAQIVSTAFGNWSLRCRKEAPAQEKPKDDKVEKPPRTCEISETLEAADHSGPLAKLSIGRPQGGKGTLFAIVIVPNNISFPSAVHIRTDDKDIWGVRLDWVRCIPGGCFAQTELAEATINYWHGLDTQGEIRFPDSSGEEVALPLSFHGFGAALDALNKSF